MEALSISDAGVLVEADVPERMRSSVARNGSSGRRRGSLQATDAWSCRTRVPDAGILRRSTHGAGRVSQLAEGFEPREWLAANGTHVVLVAGSSTTPDAVVRVDVATGVVETLKSSSAVSFPAALLSVPESVEFPSSDGHDTHAFYYPPRNADYTGLDGERPPLILIGHGGPTTATSATLDLKVQFWTSRGFAVADVNYGGSSGFGRRYRERLNGQWGVLDVHDMIAAAQYLVATGKADPNRLMIRGGSAGGYTTLAALAFHPGVFKAGASYYGISDIEVLARDTHKFESRYLDTLVGPYPAAQRRVLRALADSLRRPPRLFADPLSGSRGQGRPAEPVRDDGGCCPGEGTACGVSCLRRRAARIQKGGNHRPLPRGGTVFLWRRLRIRSSRRDRTDQDRQPCHVMTFSWRAIARNGSRR